MAPPSVPAPPSHCGTINPAPQLPHGADATAAQMQTANDAFTAWATDTHTKLECRREETRVLMAQATAAHDDFNNSVTQMNDVTTSWQAEVAAYNTRHGHAPAGHQPEERLHR